MPGEILNGIWKLRTDPFYPETDVTGARLAAAALDKTLDPTIDERVIPYYFDVYDWSQSTLVGELSAQEGLRRFPEPRTLPGVGLLVLISGDRESGLDSLANLVLHKIRRMSSGPQQKPTIVVEVELEGRDKNRNVETVASEIINCIKFCATIPSAKEIATDMRVEYTRVVAEQAGRKDATYLELFRLFKQLVAPTGHSLVIKVTRGGDFDSWMRISESARACCPYAIVTTANVAQAKTCYEAMVGNNQNVVWIQALPLNHAKAREFLRMRLAAHRVGDLPPAVDAYFPFTAEALDALYEPGADAAPDKPVHYPIGWLRRTLYSALKEQLDALGRQAGAGIDPARTAIGRAEIVTVRNRMNRGG